MLRVATYNVHDCIGRDGAYAPDRIAAIVAGFSADVVALQEITLDHAGDLRALIEQTTGMHAIDGTLFERGVGRYGNLLLVRGGVGQQALFDLSHPGREPRGLVRLTQQALGGQVDFCATHLGLGPGERRRQFARLAEYLAIAERPTILLGDFNVPFGSLAFRPLLRQGFQRTVVRTYPTWRQPLLALDRILLSHELAFARHWRYREGAVRIASDHFPLLAEIDLKP